MLYTRWCNTIYCKNKNVKVTYIFQKTLAVSRTKLWLALVLWKRHFRCCALRSLYKIVKARVRSKVGLEYFYRCHNRLKQDGIIELYSSP